MTPKFFDIHTHAHFAAYDDDRDAVMTRAREAGVAMINVGTKKDTSEMAVEFAEAYPGQAFATVGLHPIHTGPSFHDTKESALHTPNGEAFDGEYYRHLAEHDSVVAIGECGLDFFRIEPAVSADRNEESRIKQEDVFRKQIELAIEINKPLMIHCRNAYKETFEILNSYFLPCRQAGLPAGKAGLIHNSKLRGNIHFFAGTWEEAKWFLDLGFTISFTGVITFAREYDEVIKNAPLEQIMIETDAPYVTPVPYRGKRNEPAYVVEVAKKIAEIRNESFEGVQKTLLENTRRVFF